VRDVEVVDDALREKNKPFGSAAVVCDEETVDKARPTSSELASIAHMFPIRTHLYKEEEK
jgi:hypothetical protein